MIFHSELLVYQRNLDDQLIAVNVCLFIQELTHQKKKLSLQALKTHFEIHHTGGPSIKSALVLGLGITSAT